MPRTPEPIAWLSLIDVSGPFLAGTVLEDVFPQGLDKIETPRRQRLRAAYEEWVDAVDESDPDLKELHAAWVRMVLTEGLEYDDEVLVSGDQLNESVIYLSPDHGVETRPDFAVRNGDGKSKFLVSIYSAGTSLEKVVPDAKWPTSPAERMTLLCRANDCRTGLVTNGEQWMLVNAPMGETSGYASWYARFWWQEPVTLKAFQSLLGVRRCFGPEDETLPRLLDRSLEFQDEVTTTLGEQVRRAVEVLIQSLGRADQDRNGELLKEVSPAELYEAGLTVMMRLVFVLCAEERNLLLLGDPIYDQHYAISTLRAKLREDGDQFGLEVLERRHDAWSRLLCVFRGIYGGIEHDALRLPALGGSLFDPDRFPFLEGRPRCTKWLDAAAVPLPIDNRTVLLLLTALQVLERKGGAQLLSYRALDVEQIGHVYEGLLEFTAARVPDVSLGLIGTKKLPNPQIALLELESFSAKGDSALLDHLTEVTGRSVSALRNAIGGTAGLGALPKLILACHGDEQIAQRILTFSELIRSDSWGNLLVYPKGSFAIVKGKDRRSSGTHYTPRSLTVPIVRYTLEPLVFVGSAEGRPSEEWNLKSSADILALKVCDMACGSGAFLVEACRYLSQRLVEAWAVAETGGLSVGIDGVARPSSEGYELLPHSLDDRLLLARRLVAQSCLYGVDVNHLAVELAKLSIWLVTLAKNKPFSFLDHALRCGDSLVGLHDVEQLRFYNLKPDVTKTVLFKGPLNKAVDEAIALRTTLEGVPVNSVADVEAQHRLLVEADEKVARLRCAADLLVSAELWEVSAKQKAERTRAAVEASQYHVANGSIAEFAEVSSKARRGQQMFHWPLEFPEVMVTRSGFDAFVGNPPFVTGTSISTYFGDEYKAFLKSTFVPLEGRADLCVVFLRRAASLLRKSGAAGFLGSDTTSEGDSRISGPSHLIRNGYPIFRAVKRQAWPGGASVRVCQCYFFSGDWSGVYVLDNRVVDAINSSFEVGLELSEPFALAESKAMSFTGTKVYGNGFVLSLAEGEELRSVTPSNCAVVKRYMIGRELNEVRCEPGRYIIDFTDMSIAEASTYIKPWAIVQERVREKRQAAPEQRMRDVWWEFQRPRRDLYEILQRRGSAWVIAATSDTVAFVAVPYSAEEPVIFSHAVNVLTLDGPGAFAVVQSSVHLSWARKYGSSMRGDMRYTTTDCFENYPFPGDYSSLSEIGSRYYEHRRKIAQCRNIGLTDVYHAFHMDTELSADVQKLRELHIEMDQAVVSRYGWNDIDLRHDFYETAQGIRFTIDEVARRTLLTKLLKLNHERYADEGRQGVHKKKTRKKSTSKLKQKPAANQLALLGAGKEQTILATPEDTWYFAYGSNMSKGRKQERTGLIRSARKAKLKDFRLAFNKDGGTGGVYANILPSKNEEVWGVVYLCDPAAMAELDRREGVMSGHYKRVTVPISVDSGDEIDAVTYIAGEEFVVQEGLPTDDYVAFIFEGAAEHSLPQEYIETIRILADETKRRS